tara:strand:+ start:3884 stop:4543 length:660 start_codon:yes stop_codon:yes gene_type:complete
LKKNNMKIVISCDGGAASGKTTGAKLISKKYKLKFLSSGMLYRYAGFLLLQKKPKNKILFLKKIFKKLNISKIQKKINLNSQRVSEHTSQIAKIKKIRDILKNYQIDFSKKHGKCIIEGRDISTEILPGADVKFYFTCDLDIAAKRRYKELKKYNSKIKLLEVKKSIKSRNLRDKNRKHSPLLKHRDALEIHTGKLNKNEMIKKMSKHIDRVIKNKYGN